MSDTVYATAEDWAALYPDEEAPDEAALRAASRRIDSLTFGRIGEKGFDALTDFQKKSVRQAVCGQARFERDNGGMYSFAMSSYSINGVSMKSAVGMNVYSVGGVSVPGDVYALLRQTGLCGRCLG